MGSTGAVFGNMVGYIEPLRCFPATLVFIAMSLLGGKGTLWDLSLAPYCFMVKEATWTYLLGLQWVVLGLILIVNIVYFNKELCAGYSHIQSDLA